MNGDGADHWRVPVVVLWPLVEAYEEIGGDVGALMRRHGGGGPAGLGEGASALSRERFAAIAGEILYDLQSHIAGRSGAPRFPLSTFRMMCRAMLSTATLGEAIDVAIEFVRILGGDGLGRIDVSGREVFFTVTSTTRERGKAAFLVSVFGVAILHRLLGWLTGAEIPLVRVAFAFSPRPVPELLQSLFRREPEFEAPRTGFGFDAGLLGRPLVQTGVDLEGLFRFFPFDLFPPDYRAESLGARVRTLLRGAMVRGETPPGLERIAAAHGVSVSTVRRRLAEEGTSLSDLQKALREEIATALLADRRHRVSEVAARLGYRDPATFRRAFQMWTGLSPAAWRRQAARPHPISEN